MSKSAKKNIIEVAYPDRSAGNDPKPLGFGLWAFTTKAQHYYVGKYGSNDLPRPRRSALSKCFLFVYRMFVPGN